MAETKTDSKNNENENEIIDNFSTENLDYAFLDEEPLEEFGILPEKENQPNPENPEKKSENSAEFSKNYEEKKSDSDNIIAVGKDVHSEKGFEQVSEEDLPELESERDEPAEIQNQNDTEEISALEELESPEETMPFSFIQIAANDTNLTELRAEVSDTIVQNSDGTFRIADKSAYYSNKGIDLNLKKLVDSVLKN